MYPFLHFTTPREHCLSRLQFCRAFNVSTRSTPSADVTNVTARYNCQYTLRRQRLGGRTLTTQILTTNFRRSGIHPHSIQSMSLHMRHFKSCDEQVDLNPAYYGFARLS